MTQGKTPKFDGRCEMFHWNFFLFQKCVSENIYDSEIIFNVERKFASSTYKLIFYRRKEN